MAVGAGGSPVGVVWWGRGALVSWSWHLSLDSLRLGVSAGSSGVLGRVSDPGGGQRGPGAPSDGHRTLAGAAVRTMSALRRHDASGVCPPAPCDRPSPASPRGTLSRSQSAGMVYTKFEKASAQAVCLAIFHPKRPWVLISFESGLIELWDHLMDQKLMSFSEHVGPVFGLAFHPSLPMFASGGHDQKVRLWDTDTGALIHTFVGHQDYVTVVDFHAEQPWLLSGSDDQLVKVWNWQSRTRLADLVGHTNYVTAAAFHATSDLVASSSLDHTLRVWDLSPLKTKTASGIQRVAMQVLTLPLTVVTKHSLGQLHSRPINDMVWTDTTAYTMATAGDDSSVRLWKYTPGDSDSPGTLVGQATLTGFDSYPVVSVNCSSRGMLVAANSNGLLKFYDLETRAYIDSVCVPPPLLPGQRGGGGAPDSKFEFFTTHPTQDLMALIYTSGVKVVSTQRERPASVQGRDGKTIYYISDNKMYSRAVGGSSVGLGTLRKEISGLNSFGAGRLALRPTGLQVSDGETFPALVDYFDGVNYTSVCIDPSRERTGRGKSRRTDIQQAFGPSACSPAVQVLVPPVLCDGLVAVLGQSRDYVSVWDAGQFGWVEEGKGARKVVVDQGVITVLPGGHNRVLLVYQSKIQLLDIVEKRVLATCVNTLISPDAEGGGRAKGNFKYSVVGNRIHPMYTGEDRGVRDLPRQMWPYYIALLSSHRVDILKVSTSREIDGAYKVSMSRISHVTLKSRVKGGVWSQLIKSRCFFSVAESTAGIEKGLYDEVPRTVFVFSTLTHICYISPATQSKAGSGVLTSINRPLYPALLDEASSKFWYVERSGVPRPIPLEGSLGALGEGIRIARRACEWLVSGSKGGCEGLMGQLTPLAVELARVVKRASASHLGLSPIVYLSSMSPPPQHIAEALVERACNEAHRRIPLDVVLSLIPSPSLDFIRLLHSDTYLRTASSPAALDKLKVLTASACLKGAREGRLRTATDVLWESLETGYNEELLEACLAVFAMSGWEEGLEFLRRTGEGTEVGALASLLLDGSCAEGLEACGYSGLAEWVRSNRGGDGAGSPIIACSDIEDIRDSPEDESPLWERLERLVGMAINGRASEDKEVVLLRSLVDEAGSAPQPPRRGRRETWATMEEDGGAEEGDWDIEDDDAESASPPEDRGEARRGKEGNGDSEGWDGGHSVSSPSPTETTTGPSESDATEARRPGEFQPPKHNQPPWASWEGTDHPYTRLVTNFYRTGEFENFFENFEEIAGRLRSGQVGSAAELLEKCGVSLPRQDRRGKSRPSTPSLRSTGMLAEAARLCAASVIPLSLPPFPDRVVFYPRTQAPSDPSATMAPNTTEPALVEQMDGIKLLVTKGKVHSALAELRSLIPKIFFAGGSDDDLNRLLREAGGYCCGVYSDTERRKLKERNAGEESLEDHVEELRLHFAFPHYAMDPEHQLLALRQGITVFARSGLGESAAMLARRVLGLSKGGVAVEKRTLDRMKKLSSADPATTRDAVAMFESCPALEDFDVERFALDTFEYLESPAYCPVCNASFSPGLAGRECPCCTCGVVAEGRRELCGVGGMGAGGE